MIFLYQGEPFPAARMRSLLLLTGLLLTGLLLLPGCSLSRGGGEAPPAAPPSQEGPGGPPPSAEIPTPQPAPQPSPQPSPEPQLLRMLVSLGAPDGPEPTAPVKASPGQEVPVGAGAVTVTWYFNVPETAGLASGLRIQGHWVESVDALSGFVRVRFPANGPDRWETWLEGVPDSRIALIRPRDSEVSPFLERIDLVTGERERVMELPREIILALLSPDRSHLALQVWQRPQERVHGWWPTRTILADLEAKLLHAPGLAGHELVWGADGTLYDFGPGFADGQGRFAWYAFRPQLEPVKHEGRVHWVALSPDGRQAAFLDYAAVWTGPVTFETAEPVDLVIFDLQTGATRRIAAASRSWYTGKGGDHSHWVAWHPNGRQVALLDPVERNGRTDLLLFDPVTGERRGVVEGVDLSVRGTRLQYSPDGTRLLTSSDGHVGKIFHLDGRPTLSLPAFSYGRPTWDQAGSRLLVNLGEPWQGVYIWAPETGTQIELGPGMAAGWDGQAVYVIRWPGSAERYDPGAY